MKKLLKAVVREAYFRLGCYEDDEHVMRLAIIYAPADAGNDVIIAELQNIAQTHGATLGRTLRFASNGAQR